MISRYIYIYIKNNEKKNKEEWTICKAARGRIGILCFYKDEEQTEGIKRSIGFILKTEFQISVSEAY